MYIYFFLLYSILSLSVSCTRISESHIRQKTVELNKYCKNNGYNTKYGFLVNMSTYPGNYRCFLVNLRTGEIVHASRCAHGTGKKSTLLKPVFSNTSGSHCTSLGKYLIGSRSWSNWGIHVHYKLHGLESTNSNAFKRTVVFHSHWSMPQKESIGIFSMGCSHGCPVVDNKSMKIFDNLLKKEKKVILWIYSS